MPQSYIAVSDQEVDASTVTIPDTRHFRDAWKLSGDVIEEDLDEARKLHRQRIRTARAPLLEALDVEYMRLQETGADTSACVAKKQALRDAPAASGISTAASTDDLKAQWDTTNLGTSPYS